MAGRISRWWDDLAWAIRKLVQPMPDVSKSFYGPPAVGQTELARQRSSIFDLRKTPPLASLPGMTATSEAGGDVGVRSLPENQLAEPEAIYYDPYAVSEQLGFRNRPIAIPIPTLKEMAKKIPIIPAIVQTRVNQVASFCQPQRNRFDPGFRVKLRDQEAVPTDADRKYAKYLERLIMTSGTVTDSREHDNFEKFVRKVIKDSLELDAMCFEIVPDRLGRPAAWYAVDASTIMFADDAKLYPSSNLDAPAYVQVYDNVVVGQWSKREMAYAVRNPRTDIRSFGYGTSEIEMMVGVLTAFLHGFQYNSLFFQQGTVAKGVLNLKGAIPERQLRAFRRLWYEMVSGVKNSWVTPIINADGAEWLNMQPTNREMEFANWLDFLLKIGCATWLMDPIEVNFKFGQSGGKGSMFGSADRTKLVESKSRGLMPLLRFLGRVIDQYIIWPINDNFSVEFVGLDSMTPKELADLNTQRVRTIYTINEVRAENDLSALPDGLGDLILDPNWMLAKRDLEFKKQAEEAAKQMDAMGDAAGQYGTGAPGGAPGGGAPSMPQPAGGPPPPPAAPGAPVAKSGSAGSAAVSRVGSVLYTFEG